MIDAYDDAGFDDCVLNSEDDYEPYGFATPDLFPGDPEEDAAYADAQRACREDDLDDAALERLRNL